MAAESTEDWAVSNGFSAELYEVEQANDGAYYLLGEAPVVSLDALKEQAKASVEALKDLKLGATCHLNVDDFGEVVYNQQAILNVSSLLILGGEDNQSYILANDEAVMATMEQLKLIAAVFKEYVESIYTSKLSKFAMIEACESVEALEALDLSM